MKVRKSRRFGKAEKPSTSKAIRIYTDGSGARPDGKGSGFAWLRRDTGQTHVEFADGFTNNQAEYKAILSALESVPKGSKVEVLTDSQVVCYQLSGEFRISDPDLADLFSLVRAVIEEKELSVRLEWVPRAQNLADKLIQKAKTDPHGSHTKSQETLLEPRSKNRA
jgi:ribonuclease HI